ncbi:MAG: glycosyltransferase family 4 protein [Ardenticatenaceae bacterium]|nr:glycosyltransferase family 4 protein [Anaerolineales bacterium]MCB8920936.1 glycosyltransferase family 4 protein [Ardenticatenaceae bacterium]
MRIGIDARLIHWPGIGRYIDTLLKYLVQTEPQHEYIIYHTTSENHIPFFATQAIRVTQKNFPYPAFSVAEQLYWPHQIRQDRLDVFHAPHYVAPLFTSTPVVVTIHDLVGFRYPEHFYSPFARLYYKAMTYAAARKARKCITGSNFTKQELITLLKIDPAKVQIVPYGVDTERFTSNHPDQKQITQKYNIPDSALLYLGTKKQWKNLPMLLKALNLMVKKGEQATLILAGKNARHQQDLAPLIRDLQLQEHILEVGFIEEADVSAFYAAATIFVFPSYYEGFGLPILEAMASGVPVVASNAASIPELVGDAGILMDPHTPHKWAEVMIQLLHNKPTRHELVQQGLARVQQFSWQDCAQNTFKVFQDATRQ